MSAHLGRHSTSPCLNLYPMMADGKVVRHSSDEREWMLLDDARRLRVRTSPLTIKWIVRQHLQIMSDFLDADAIPEVMLTARSLQRLQTTKVYLMSRIDINDVLQDWLKRRWSLALSTVRPFLWEDLHKNVVARILKHGATDAMHLLRRATLQYLIIKRVLASTEPHEYGHYVDDLQKKCRNYNIFQLAALVEFQHNHLANVVCASMFHTVTLDDFASEDALNVVCTLVKVLHEPPSL